MRPRTPFDRRPLRSLALLLLLPPLLAACGGGDEAPAFDRAAALETLGLPGVGTEADLDAGLASTAEAPIDPPPEVGKDYEPVFPELLPFDPAEWQTTKAPQGVADERAKKGGKLRLATLSYPPTIRTEGPNSRLALLSDLHAMIYEPMVGYSMELQDFVPGLATHWQIDDDKLTYRFRLDPRARWADGREVTADDVVATVEHLTNPDRKDPLVNAYWNDLIDYAKMLDKYTVEVRTKKAYWRSLINIGWGMQIFPAAYIRMDGATYLDEWNWKLPPGSGPYEIRPEDIKKGVSITLRRRPDWWGYQDPENEGAYNFDEIEWQVVRDQELMYNKFLAGELDVYVVGRAQRWVLELDEEESIRKGWVQRRKIYSRVPEGYGGYCFNLREPPFDKNEVRLAFAHLFNREKLFSSFFFYQYEYQDSYFPGQIWAREGAERVRYDPVRARELLAQAGWVRRDAQGFLVNEAGERFPTLTMEYQVQGFERIHQVPVHDLWDEAGIKLELKLIDPSTFLKKVWDYQFKLAWFSWTAGLFPDPRQQFHSEFADPKQTNNLNGFKNAEADAIMEAYQLEWDPAKRLQLIRRLDTILFENNLYALAWYAPYFRILWWDKFGHPPEYASPYSRDLVNLMAYWWYDPARHRAMSENRAGGEPSYPDAKGHQYDDPEFTYWKFHDKPMPDGE